LTDGRGERYVIKNTYLTKRVLCFLGNVQTAARKLHGPISFARIALPRTFGFMGNVRTVARKPQVLMSLVRIAVAKDLWI
jgi:hypothetical protein